jgi:cell division septation protein DedD
VSPAVGADTSASSSPGPTEEREAASPAPEEPISPVLYSVQLGAFRDRERARQEMERLVGRDLSVRLDREESDGTLLYKIRLGRCASKEEAEDLARRLCRGLTWQVVRISP